MKSLTAACAVKYSIQEQIRFPCSYGSVSLSSVNMLYLWH